MLALAGGTVYTEPSARPISDGVVVVDQSRIVSVGARDVVAIPSNARVLDCTGLTVAAGFWNCHVHFFERKWAAAAEIPADELSEQLRDFTRYGFTSVFDLGSAWTNTRAIRDRIASGDVDGPAIYSAGEILIPPGAMPAESVLRVLGVVPHARHEAPDAHQAHDAATAVLSQGTDALKVFMSGNGPNQKLSADAVAAALRVSREAQKPVFAHTNDGEDVLAALEAGVDVIAHTTPRSGPWAPALIETAKRKRAALTPTLALWPHLMRHDRLSVVRSLENTAVEQLRAWNAAGCEVLFGTDYGAAGPDPSREFSLMRAAGMTFAQILDALTTAPAKRFGNARSGRIAPGFEGDLVAFATPFDVRYTIRRGHIVYG